MKRVLAMLGTVAVALLLVGITAVSQLTRPANAEKIGGAGCENLPSEAQLRQL